MHSALYDQLMELGPANLIDRDVCRKCHTSPPVVALVLTHVVINANRHDQVWMSAQTLADDLGVIDSRAAQRALRALRVMGVLFANGRRGRATLHYVDLPETSAESHAPDVAAARETSRTTSQPTSRTTSRTTSQPTSQPTSHGTYKQEQEQEREQERARERRRRTRPTRSQWVEDFLFLVNEKRPTGGREEPVGATDAVCDMCNVIRRYWPPERAYEHIAGQVDLRTVNARIVVSLIAKLSDALVNGETS